MTDNYVDGYDTGFVVGFEEGQKKGYTQGYEDAVTDYEPRLAQFGVEMVTLNARISYLEKLTGLKHD